MTMNLNKPAFTLPEHKLQKLADRARIVSLTVKFWSATKKDKRMSKQSADLNSVKNDKLVRTYKSLFADNGLLDRIKAEGNAARQTLHQMTSPWCGENRRVLAVTRVFEFQQKFLDHSIKFNQAVEDFLSTYTELRENAKTVLGDAWLESDYPSPHKLRNKFKMTFNVEHVPQRKPGAPADKDSPIHQVEDALEAEYKYAQECIDETIKRGIEAQITDVYERIKDPLTHLVKRIDAVNEKVKDNNVSGGQLHKTVIENIREMVDMIPLFNVTDDPEVAHFLDKIKRDVLKHDTETLRVSPHARQETKELTERILSSLDEYI